MPDPRSRPVRPNEEQVRWMLENSQALRDVLQANNLNITPSGGIVKMWVAALRPVRPPAPSPFGPMCEPRLGAIRPPTGYGLIVREPRSGRPTARRTAPKGTTRRSKRTAGRTKRHR
jgi:hypothetical protein